MSDRLMRASERWFRVLLRLYPPDFRDELGGALVETYRDRARQAMRHGGASRLAGLWFSALVDSLRNGLAERGRPAAFWRRSGNWGRDLELASRRLVRAPLFAAAVIATLTAGLGAFAVVYTVVQRILIDPMPYQDPDDLYVVWRDYTAYFDLNRGWLGGPDVAELQKAGGVIEDAAGLQRVAFTFSARGMDPTEVWVMVATPNLFELLGVQPALGRGFAPTEVGPGREPVIVLTHDLWNRLGADASIIGTDIRLNGQPYTVIGVMPRSFAFARNASLGPPQRADAYATFPVNLAEMNPGAGSYSAVIRARRGASPEALSAAVDRIGRLVDERDHQSRGLTLYAVGLKPDLVAGVRPALVVLGAAGVFLVLVLMVNLASLLLARAAQREQEFAVSRALGANGVAVVRATVLEGILLGLTGGATGAAAAIWGTRALVALAPVDLPRLEAVAVDWRIGAVVVGTGALVGALGAIAPAIWAARGSLATLLASAAVRGGGRPSRMRRGMVVTQVALSLVLLSAGGLVVRSFERLLRSDPGFRPDGILTMRVPMPAQFIGDSAEVLAVQQRIHDALAAIPGVTGVSAVDALPLRAGANQTAIAIPGAPGNTGDPNHDAPLVDYIATRAGYVEVMGLRLLAGRGFDPARREGVREAFVDRHLAAHFFPTGTPIGATIPFRDSTLTVVGVVDQARLYDVHQDGRPQLYLRAEDWDYRNLSFVLRSERAPEALSRDAQAAIRRIDPRLAVADVRAMNAIVDDALRRQRISAVLIGGFAVGALVLAAMGLFGVVAGSVARRRHELGVRLALGADHRRLLRLVLGEGLVLVGLGLLIGLPAVYASGVLVRGVLVGVSATDPATLVAVATGLLVTTMCACYLPARRVLTIEPAKSLRHD